MGRDLCVTYNKIGKQQNELLLLSALCGSGDRRRYAHGHVPATQ
jgi:hypothetical protein